MKRLFLSVAVLLLGSAAVFAYNPPVNAENYLDLSSTRLLSGGDSVTGGGISSVGPESIVVNPALTADEQRTTLNLGYTALINTDKSDDTKYGNSMQAGIIIPFKFAVFTGFSNFTAANFNNMDLGNSFNARFALSKEITDKLDIGLGLNSGFFWGKENGSDWLLSANIGYVYNFGQVGGLKDFKYGISLLNLGKNFNDVTFDNAIKAGEKVTAFPSVATAKIGTSALFISNDAVKFGFNFDVTAPMFMNVIFDAGLQFSVKDIFYINVADRFNLAEFVNGHKDFIPSVGISFRFAFNFKDNEYMEKNGWEQSEMSASIAYKKMYQTINACSANVDLRLGMKDTTPPVIQLFVDEGDDE